MPGDCIENPVTGERIRFLRTGPDTDGKLLQLELTWPRPGRRTPEHVHPEMEERYEVLAGAARVRIGGTEATLGPGEVAVVPPGAPHVAWNPTDAEVRVRVEFRPALRWEEFVRRLFRLAEDGHTNELGVPEPEVLAEFLREFHRELAPAP